MDLSSDVCSSDLFAFDVGQDLAFVLSGENVYMHIALLAEAVAAAHGLVKLFKAVIQTHKCHACAVLPVHPVTANFWFADQDAQRRSEERRVGKEWDRTCRSRGWPDV